MCRVPVYLLHLFPHTKIYKSQKISVEKAAKMLASSLEYLTQQFLHKPRTGILNPAIKKTERVAIITLPEKRYMRMF